MFPQYIRTPVADAYGYVSEGGIVYLIIGLVILVLSNALSDLLLKSFNLNGQYGRFLGGLIILFTTFMLALSTNDDSKFKSALLFGLGEVIIGGLDIVNDRLSTTLPLLIPDPGCQAT